MKEFAMIGFGEAGMAFARAGAWAASAKVFDAATLGPATAESRSKLADYRTCGVSGQRSNALAVANAGAVLSLVTADLALAAASESAAGIAAGALYFDMNSVAPDTKAAAAAAIEGAGGRYVDVAIMAPVDPAALGVPLLVSGAEAQSGADILAALGFRNIRVVGASVGQASAIKMIRSVMVKGLEALTAECLLAADRAGVTAEVLGSLGGDWAAKADYNLDRMMVHGSRRAAEMEEAVRTLEGVGVEPLITRGTVARQRAIGALAIRPVPLGLNAKLERLRAA